MWLGENIGKLIFRGDWEQFKSTMDKMIVDKMTINLDVFNSFMEDIIMKNMNDILVIIGCRHT